MTQYVKHPLTGRIFVATDLILERKDMIPYNGPDPFAKKSTTKKPVRRTKKQSDVKAAEAAAAEKAVQDLRDEADKVAQSASTEAEKAEAAALVDAADAAAKAAGVSFPSQE